MSTTEDISATGRPPSGSNSSESKAHEDQISDKGSSEEISYPEPTKGQIQQIIGVKGIKLANDPKIYYVKWFGQSYVHCSWLTLDEVLHTPSGDQALKDFNFRSSYDDLSPSPSISNLLINSQEELNPNWFTPDRILSEKDGKYFVKWKFLPYDQSTWEKPESIPYKFTVIERFKSFSRHFNPTSSDHEILNDHKFPFSAITQEISNNSGTSFLRTYQLKGVNWLRFCWFNHRNSILADEMGLGKTVQVVCAMNDLNIDHQITGPFLVIAPLSALEHWVLELERWTQFYVVLYHGSSVSRRIIEKYEFPASDSKILSKLNTKSDLGFTMHKYDKVKFDVLVTNYETFTTDFELFKAIEWKYLALDEGQRLTNRSEKCYQLLTQLKYDHCTLLTGTPIPNNVEELWSLLHLLNPQTFSDLNEFLNNFGNINDINTLQNLQTLIHPYVLRRRKVDVGYQPGDREESIIEVELTRSQKAFYKTFLHNNASTLLHPITEGSLPSLSYLMIQLRKVFNHPFLINEAQEQIEAGCREKYQNENFNESELKLKSLVECSGKLILIDKLLPKLNAEMRHRIIIISQMVEVLDILSDYLSLKKINFERFDQNLRESDTHSSIQNFLNPTIVFLLHSSGECAGLSADAIILFDSNLNPQFDLSPPLRCHRIRQVLPSGVKAYRLVTRGTFELEMLERSSKKLRSDLAIVDGGGIMGEKPIQAYEVEKLLRKGAYVITHDDDSEIDNFNSADIDHILERRSHGFKAFNNDENDIQLESTDFWKNILSSISTD